MYHLVCSNCGQINRAPPDKLRLSPKCGRCSGALLPHEPVELDPQSWQKLKEKSDVPVVVDFWAPWCGPCKMMAPEFAATAQALHPANAKGNGIPPVLFAKLNTEQYPQPAGELSIRGIPTVIMFHRGKEIARQAGAMNRGALQSWIQAHQPQR